MENQRDPRETTNRKGFQVSQILTRMAAQSAPAAPASNQQADPGRRSRWMLTGTPGRLVFAGLA